MGNTVGIGLAIVKDRWKTITVLLQPKENKMREQTDIYIPVI